MQPGKLDSWISFFTNIMGTSLGPDFETPTESSNQIE